MTNDLPKPSPVSLLLADNYRDFTILLTLFSFRLSRSINTPSAELSFSVDKTLLGTEPQDDLAYIAKDALRVGNMVQLSIEGKTAFTGYITSLNQTSSENSDQLDVTCKDVIWRLETTVLNHMRGGLNGKQPLVKILDWALDGLKEIDPNGLPTKVLDLDDWFYDIKIEYDQKLALQNLTGKPPTKDVATDIKAEKEADAKPKENETIYAFLRRLIRPWGYILQASADGNLIVFRPNNQDETRHWFVNDKSPNKQYGEQSIAMIGQASLREDISQLHSHYYIFAPTASSSTVSTRASFRYTNPDYPPSAPRNNYVEYNQDVTSKAACEKLAKRKCGFELAASWQYSFSVPTLGTEGLVFSNDICVIVEDAYNDIESSEVYVLGIDMEMNANSQRTTFTCVKTTALVLE